MFLPSTFLNDAAIDFFQLLNQFICFSGSVTKKAFFTLILFDFFCILINKS